MSERKWKKKSAQNESWRGDEETGQRGRGRGSRGGGSRGRGGGSRGGGSRGGESRGGGGSRGRGNSERGNGFRGRGKDMSRGGKRENQKKRTLSDEVDVDDRPKKKMRVLDENASSVSTIHLSDVSFQDLDISDESKRALEHFEKMTVVQAETFPKIMEGFDILAKAKTGTGKTIGFLLPSLELLLEEMRSNPDQNRISMLVISPTRELAMQIYNEGQMLTKFHNSVSLGVFTGGVKKSKDDYFLSKKLDILVATPGRLIDHLENTPRFSGRFENMKVVVLDEADRLLDMGFKKDLKKIFKYLNHNRQTLLYSATIPDSLIDMQSELLKENHVFINTVGDEEKETNVQISQEVIICALQDQLKVLDFVLREHMNTIPNYKVIIFFNTARACGFNAQLFQNSGMDGIIEMHSRKSQSYRLKASQKFLKQNNMIMFSSDVSARGMDYDGITLVIQVGLTDREQYIHRVGRTGRAGAVGQGILILSPFEKKLLSTLKDIPITQCEVDMSSHDFSSLESALRNVENDFELKKSAEQSYQAFLGYYNSNLKIINMNKDQLVALANEYSYYIGLNEIPGILRKVIGKMGMRGVKGLNII